MKRFLFLLHPFALRGRTVRRPLASAFSLVEVTCAIGIVAFAFVAILGMLPIGLNSFRDSLDGMMAAQIAQQVIGEARQGNFSALQPSDPSGESTFRGNIRYFDDRGNELDASRKTEAIYQVNTRIMSNTPVPSSTAGNADLATVTVQISNTPGGVPLDASLLVSSSGPLCNLWQSAGGHRVVTFSTLVARNR